MPELINTVPSPGDYIREELDRRQWTQADLAHVLGRPLPTLNRILNGKHAVLPEMAIALGEAFGTGPEIWVQREASFRLSLASPSHGDVKRRARLHELAPIGELRRRGWISSNGDGSVTEKEICRFFELTDIEQEPKLSAAMRKADANLNLSPAQLAWCFRVRHLGKSIAVGPYKEHRLAECMDSLRKLAAYPVESRKVSKLLSEFGIRFVVVEHLGGTKIDGTTMWLDDDAPVIGVSLRYSRIDAFWFTLCHELSHVRHRDAVSLDADVLGQDSIPLTVKPAFERRADEEAADSLVPSEVLTSFIERVGPLYSKKSINQFAHRMKIHPGIIVGQLQKRDEIGWKSHRDMLPSIKEAVMESSLTDGWGHVFSPES